MSGKIDYNNQHQTAAETHTHGVAEAQGRGEHLSPAELSRHEHEHSTYGHSHEQKATVGHGIASFGHKEIAALAHELWEARGCPEGTADEDWHKAAEMLRARAHTA